MELCTFIDKARDRLITMYYNAGSGHLGGALSCLDVLMVLYHQVMEPNDGFILSKGHAAGAWYVTLWSRGLLSSEQLDSFNMDGGLPGHPSGSEIPGLLFATGSLGHGLPLAAGLALAAKHKGDHRRFFCLCSDGEWQEGSNWESLIFLVHHGLNVTIIVDQNGWQGFGRVREVSSVEDIAPRLAAFNLEVSKCPGHDPAALIAALSPRVAGPRAVVLDTVKGHGLDCFADRLESHYLPLTEKQYLEYRTFNGSQNDENSF